MEKQEEIKLQIEDLEARFKVSQESIADYHNKGMNDEKLLSQLQQTRNQFDKKLHKLYIKLDNCNPSNFEFLPPNLTYTGTGVGDVSSDDGHVFSIDTYKDNILKMCGLSKFEIIRKNLNISSGLPLPLKVPVASSMIWNEYTTLRHHFNVQDKFNLDHLVQSVFKDIIKGLRIKCFVVPEFTDFGDNGTGTNNEDDEDEPIDYCDIAILSANKTPHVIVLVLPPGSEVLEETSRFYLELGYYLHKLRGLNIISTGIITTYKQWVFCSLSPEGSNTSSGSDFNDSNNSTNDNSYVHVNETTSNTNETTSTNNETTSTSNETTDNQTNDSSSNNINTDETTNTLRLYVSDVYDVTNPLLVPMLASVIKTDTTGSVNGSKSVRKNQK